MIKDEIIENGESFENALLRYVDESDLYQLKEIIPALTIFVPELPEDSFSADIWDATNEIPNVAIRCKDSDGVTAYTGDGEEYIIEAKYIPGYPIVVVKENERIIANHLSTKSSTTVIQNPNSNLTFMFTDEAFNNLTHKVTLRGSPTSEPIPEKLAKSMRLILFIRLGMMAGKEIIYTMTLHPHLHVDLLIIIIRNIYVHLKC